MLISRFKAFWFSVSWHTSLALLLWALCCQIVTTQVRCMKILLNHILYILNHGTQVCACSDEIKARSVFSLWRTKILVWLKIWEFKQVLLISCEIQLLPRAQYWQQQSLTMSFLALTPKIRQMQLLCISAPNDGRADSFPFKSMCVYTGWGSVLIGLWPNSTKLQSPPKKQTQRSTS